MLLATDSTYEPPALAFSLARVSLGNKEFPQNKIVKRGCQDSPHKVDMSFF